MADESPQRPAITPHLVFGLLLIVAGILVLLDRMDVMHSGFLASWWPAGLAGIGLLQLIFGDNPLAKVLGCCLVLLGGALVFANLNPDLLRSDDVWSYAWPVALLAFGVFLVMRTFVPDRPRPADSKSRVNIFTFWSGQDRTLSSQSFEGGELTSIMGGYDLDLREADIPAGGEAVLEVFSLMGGGSIRVPEAWTVDSEVTPFMGGVSVKTHTRTDTPIKRLRIKGLALMGGIEVRN